VKKPKEKSKEKDDADDAVVNDPMLRMRGSIKQIEVARRVRGRNPLLC
jgi:hypothetical protein